MKAVVGIPEPCHICRRPKNKPGEIWCSYPHPGVRGYDMLECELVTDHDCGPVVAVVGLPGTKTAAVCIVGFDLYCEGCLVAAPSDTGDTIGNDGSKC